MRRGFSGLVRPLTRPGTWLLLILLAQAGWHLSLEPVAPRPRALPPPPSLEIARALALGEPLVLSRLIMLWLQAFDTQAGTDIALADLDYARVEAWLQLCLALAPEAQYPLLAASRLYAEIPDPGRARRMLAFVSAAFAQDPARRWPWLAHAVFVARHRLQAPALALHYAHQLAAEPAPGIPAWARQMEIFVLEDMGEIEAARTLLGGLLASGQITDPHEARFLAARLAALEAPRGQQP